MHSSHQAHLTNPPSTHCCSMLQVLSKAPSSKESGKAFLEEITPLVQSFPHNQALMCLHARQLLRLGRYQEALQAVAPCLGCGNDLAPSRWALHLTVHAHWLTGGLDQVCPHSQPQQLAETGSHLLTNDALQAGKLCSVSCLLSCCLGIFKLGSLCAADVVCVRKSLLTPVTLALVSPSVKWFGLLWPLAFLPDHKSCTAFASVIQPFAGQP